VDSNIAAMLALRPRSPFGQVVIEQSSLVPKGELQFAGGGPSAPPAVTHLTLPSPRCKQTSDSNPSTGFPSHPCYAYIGMQGRPAHVPT
jgi:hypothetical protein